MANSTCISEWKNKILSEIENDDLIIKVLDVSDEELEGDLRYTRLFPYDFIPEVEDEVKTFITVSISVTRISDDGKWCFPKIFMRVIGHQRHMQLKLPTISKNRMDYLAELLDKKFNGRRDFGYSGLVLQSNIEDNLNDRFKYRQLIFEATDLNDSVCDTA